MERALFCSCEKYELAVYCIFIWKYEVRYNYLLPCSFTLPITNKSSSLWGGKRRGICSVRNDEVIKTGHNAVVSTYLYYNYSYDEILNFILYGDDKSNNEKPKFDFIRSKWMQLVSYLCIQFGNKSVMNDSFVANAGSRGFSLRWQLSSSVGNQWKFGCWDQDAIIGG